MGEPIPFLAVWGDDLGEEVKNKYVKCPNCGKQHLIEYGKSKNKKEEWEENKAMWFVTCEEEAFVVSLDNKLIK